MSRKTWIRLLLVGGALAIGVAVVLIASLFPDNDSVTRAKEMVLRDDLFTMRSCINQYTLDKQKRPQALPDLVSAGYLKAIPKDPFTSSSATWRLTPDGNVHSGAQGMGSDGKPYNSW
jgi:general secretion pathway protein G